MTPLRNQAVKWCGKFKRRGKQGIVTIFEFKEDTQENLKILKFDSYSEEWLDFIMNCRREKDSSDYEKEWGFLLKQHWVFFIIHSCIS